MNEILFGFAEYLVKCLADYYHRAIEEGDKPNRIVSSKLNVGGKLQVDASNGNTQIYINVREITKVELRVLKAYTRFLSLLFCLHVPHEHAHSHGSNNDASTLLSSSMDLSLEHLGLQKLMLFGLEGSGTSTIFKQLFRAWARLTPQLHESAGGLPSLKLSLHSCSLPGSTNAMGIETSIALVLPAREHECNTSFVLGRPPHFPVKKAHPIFVYISTSEYIIDATYLCFVCTYGVCEKVLLIREAGALGPYTLIIGSFYVQGCSEEVQT
ncbi:hypothetical protein Tco_1282954 [Tanacetum coccineum]